MTDENPESGDVLTDDPAPAEAANEPIADDAAAHAASEPAAPIPFWQRPNVQRYLSPLITPIVVVVGLVVYVLNISRIFLSAHGHIAVAVGSVITVVILLGATVLSNSNRLRSTSINLMTVGFVFVVLASGWLVLGHSQVKGGGGAALPVVGPYDGKFTIKAAPIGGLTFGPSSLSVKTGVYLVTLVDGAAAQHTLDFDDSSTRFPGLIVNSAGESKTGRIFFGTPGNYTFFCAVPTHRAAGMLGVVHVTGNPITLADAEAKGKTSG
jgi:plastocyanin